ncbi:dTMP kinase [Caldovatus sediminis]|uniref:dTMP kinase n=1 Tax=Caldovatus sediminis TaxID=2041189 RepID=UPI001664647F|nr:dTMP kinase [Caldovatus sediminis]
MSESAPELRTPRARFVTLEGGEGAGKSTQARRLAAALAAAGLPVLRTREPGGAPGAEAIRALLLHGGTAWDPVAEAMLHFAARREHLVRTIRPALAAGMWVVCDRFADSTLAYQGFGQGLPRAVFDALAALTLDGLAPDLTLILDLPPEAGMARASGRGEAPTRYERLGPEFHARIRAGFRAIAEAEPARCVLVDAARPAEAVAADLRALVRARLGAPLPP